MTHNEQVTPEEFEALQSKQRYLLTKPNPLFMPADTLLVTQPDSREQLTFVIQNIQPLNSRSVILGLYAPYEEMALNLS